MFVSSDYDPRDPSVHRPSVKRDDAMIMIMVMMSTIRNKLVYFLMNEGINEFWILQHRNSMGNNLVSFDRLKANIHFT